MTISNKYKLVDNAIIYSFTAPADNPSTRNLERQKYKIIIGTPIKMEPAANLVNLVSSKDINPTATVHRFLSLSKSFGNIKSLHGHANCVSIVYTSIGLDNGNVICANILPLLAPSIRAASYMELLMQSSRE